MTKTTKVHIVCSSCDKNYEIDIDSFGDIDWVCPQCKSDEHTYITDVEKPEDIETDTEKPDKYRSIRPKRWL